MPEGRRLRVLVVGAAWPAETFVMRLIAGLSENGVDVLVASASTPRDPDFARRGLRHVATPAWSGPAPRRLARLARSSAGAWLRSPRETVVLGRASRRGEEAGRLRRWNRLAPFAGRGFDLVYFPWNSAAIEHLGLFDLGRPALISCRGSQVSVAPHDPQRGRLREGLRATFAKAAAVHCVSAATRKDAEAWGLDPAKAVVIRPAVDSSYFRPAEEPRPGDGEAPLEIVTTGSLVGIKGHEYALLAIRRLADRGVSARFSIIGDGPERDRAQFTIRDLGLEPQVRLLGRKTPDQIRETLRRSDVFLLTSLSEGISNAALEAMACGLPVVTTDCGGMREAVEDGVSGRVVPIRDTEAVADALGRLASSPESRQAMGRAARARVAADFDSRRQIGEFVGLMRKAAGWAA